MLCSCSLLRSCARASLSQVSYALTARDLLLAIQGQSIEMFSDHPPADQGRTQITARQWLLGIVGRLRGSLIAAGVLVADVANHVKQLRDDCQLFADLSADFFECLATAADLLIVLELVVHVDALPVFGQPMGFGLLALVRANCRGGFRHRRLICQQFSFISELQFDLVLVSLGA